MDLDPSAPPVPPAAAPAPAPPAAAPLSAAEWAALQAAPARAFDLLLAAPDRLAATGAGPEAWRLVGWLVVVTALASVPMAAVFGLPACGKLAVLYGGSVLLAVPALQVFGAFLGLGWRPVQALVHGLAVAAVASLFSLGFAPIAWFLRATMAPGDLVDAGRTALVLVAVGLLAGFAQLVRCRRAEARSGGAGAVLLLGGWLLLVAGLAWRLGRVLGLAA